MSVKYKVIQRTNLAKPTEPKKFYAIAADLGAVDAKQLAEDIEVKTALSKTDVLAVISALTEEIAQNLLEGKIVRLDEIGSLRPTLSSKGAATREDFKPKAMIEGLNIRFRPSKELVDKLAKVEYTEHK